MRYPIKSISRFGRSSIDYFSIGPTPANEPCIQINVDDELSIVECEIYIDQLLRKFGTPPENASFFVLKNIHDAGVYYEAAIQFDENSESAVEYACNVENGDDFWDEWSKASLSANNAFACKHS